MALLIFEPAQVDNLGVDVAIDLILENLDQLHRHLQILLQIFIHQEGNTGLLQVIGFSNAPPLPG